MYDRAMAQARIDDLVRVAERERLARQTRAVRAGERGNVIRRMGGAVVHALLWPAKH